MARLLRRGVDPASILCVTYTKAAAAEMQHRLFATLGEWSVLSDEKLAGRLADLEGALDAGFDQAALSQARALFARALETPGGLKIETIHAFCEKLLRRFPLEAGVSPRFQVMEDAAAHALSQAARDRLAIAATEAEPQSLLARAFAHFAVDLDYGRFEQLFKTIEIRRAGLQRYVDRLSEGSAPSPWKLCGLPEGTLPETLEAEAVKDIDWSQWRAAAQALDAGGLTDRKIAEAMAAIEPATATFEAVYRGVLHRRRRGARLHGDETDRQGFSGRRRVADTGAGARRGRPGTNSCGADRARHRLCADARRRLWRDLRGVESGAGRARPRRPDRQDARSVGHARGRRLGAL